MGISEDDFQRLIKRASQPLESERKKDVPGRSDDYNDTQIHPHNSEDTSD